MHYSVIAIDGPAGAGKSTVAKAVARRLGYTYVDTGAMYRAVAWLAQQFASPPYREDEVVPLLTQHKLEFCASNDETMSVFADNTDITTVIRSPEISDIVSVVSTFPAIRDHLLARQRGFSESAHVVMDGRDIGTVIFPDADLKIFLTASLEERARRRTLELSTKGHELASSDIERSIRERDERDSSRNVAPLKAADDAFHIDSTGKSIDEVVQEILDLVKQVAYD